MTRGTFWLLLVFCCAGRGWAASPELRSQLDALYLRRDDPQALKELAATFDRELKAAPADYDLLWRAGQYRVWISEGTPDEAQKRALGKQSWDLAEAAVRANPSGAEGHYIAALGLGEYATGVGIVRSLTQGIEGKFTAHIDAAIKLDDGFDHGSPRVLRGRALYEVPWPLRNLKGSRAELERALAAHPENLRAWLYLSETLLKQGDRQSARRALQQVQAGAVAYDPPEGRRVRGWVDAVARQLGD